MSGFAYSFSYSYSQLGLYRLPQVEGGGGGKGKRRQRMEKRKEKGRGKRGRREGKLEEGRGKRHEKMEGEMRGRRRDEFSSTDNSYWDLLMLCKIYTQDEVVVLVTSWVPKGEGGRGRKGGGKGGGKGKEWREERGRGMKEKLITTIPIL